MKKGENIDSFYNIVKEEILKIINENQTSNKMISKIENHYNLNSDLGLQSLALAQLVASLEIRLEVDPFAQLVSITDIKTVDDLVSAYRKAVELDPERGGTKEKATDLDGQKRAKKRRQAKGRRKK